MNDGGMGAAVRGLQTLFGAGMASGLSDGQLLERYISRREDVAFEAIVHRHGPMVWGVCRRVLRDHHDAEDAFQATFLVLARRAASIVPRGMLPNWLHGVAYQTARKARASVAKRTARERTAREIPEPTSALPRDDMSDRLDRELSRLPEKYRTPIILCEIEGMTHREAAESLGWPTGTVSGRLSRGRALLSSRLSRHGSPDPAGCLALLLSRGMASSRMTSALVASTMRAACPIAAGRSMSGKVSIEVATITEGVLKAMFYARLKWVAGVVLPIGLLTVGAGVVAQQDPGARAIAASDNEGGPKQDAPADPSKAGVIRSDAGAIDGPLAGAVAGRIVRSAAVSRDGMILSYLPDWAFGDVDNIGIANNDGGVRTLVDWPTVPAEEADAPDRRFFLAFYSRKTTHDGKVGPILAFELEEDWPERSSWKAQPRYATEPAATLRFEPGEGWKLFDVTPLVRARSKEGRAGHGIVLRFLNEDAKGNGGWSGYQFASREGAGEWADRRPRFLVVEPSGR